MTMPFMEHMNKPKLPMGNELTTFLHEWLKQAEAAHMEQRYFPASINWAVLGRTREVLEWLDVSDHPLDYEVAKAIRRIGTMDRVNLGYVSGMFAQGRYGLLARELANKTWVPGNDRVAFRGETSRDFYMRYGELPYFV